MLSQYLQKAMHRAIYEKIEDETYYGEIPGFQGVYSNADNLKSCQETLQEVLEGWIILGLRLQHPLPIVDGINLNSQLEVA
jgi:predicted RNase H-like HicB family nuclease